MLFLIYVLRRWQHTWPLASKTLHLSPSKLIRLIPATAFCNKSIFGGQILYRFNQTNSQFMIITNAKVAATKKKSYLLPAKVWADRLACITIT